MMTSTLRATAVMLGAIILSVTLAGQPALAKKVKVDDDSNVAGCPCFTGKLIDEWFETTGPSKLGSGDVIACVDAPTLTTFDYFDHSASGPSPTAFLIDCHVPGWTAPAEVRT
jgi:hypothetical protein